MPGMTNCLVGSGGGASTIKVAGYSPIYLTSNINWTDEKKNAIITNLRALLAQYEALGVSIYQITGTGSIGSLQTSYQKVTSSELSMDYDSNYLYIGGSPVSSNTGQTIGYTAGLATYYLEAPSGLATQLTGILKTVWSDPETSGVYSLYITITWGADYTYTNVGSGLSIPYMRMWISD